MGEEQPDPDDEIKSCVIVPGEMVTERGQKFRCPECLAETPSSLPDYIICRGSRATRRMTSYSSLALIIFYLDSLQTTAQSLLEQVVSALCAFEVEVVSHLRQIGKQVDDEEVGSIHDRLHFEGPYHLAVIFLTEGDPRGGWWISSDKSRGGAGQTNEQKFIRYHTKALTKLAADAKTSRMFMLSCATNMFKASTLGIIYDTLNTRPWHSMVLPTTPALLVNEVIDILPALFVHSYYFGAGFKSSLLRVWAKSASARVHTGFVLMDRQSHQVDLSVCKIGYAAQSVRPYGVPLPIPESLCGCWGQDAYWKLRHVSREFGENFNFLRASCCGHEIHLAIFMDRRKIRKVHGTMVVEEDWDESLKNFTFDPSRMICMTQSPARRGPELEAQRPQHKEPWTLAGKQAQEGIASDIVGPTE